MQMEEHALTPADVAALLHVSPVTVRTWASRGELEAIVTPGGHRRFSRAAVERFAAARGIAVRFPASGPLRVLIVDDDAMLAGLLDEVLREAGAATAIAADGFDAGLALLRFRPAVVLLDLMMPGLDGFAVCNRIKADPASRGIRVIAMTGYPTVDNVERICAAGAERCLAKPFDLDALVALLGLTSLEVSAQ
ncbi:MAG: response regulator [Gammaproteobacteria bacterium]